MPSINTDVIPLVVGLSLCGASAALLYIWFQTKDAADECDTSNPSTATRLRRLSRQLSRRTNSIPPQRQQIECVIPNHLVPLVEGRAGANVRAIESQTECRISFRVRDADSQICEISGPNAAAVQQAAELVRKEAAPPPIVTDVLRVPHAACGLIVGRCGEALQDICRRSMAKVYVEAGERLTPADTDGGEQTRSIKITGTRAHVQMARALIEERVRDTERKQLSAADAESRREPRGKHQADGAGASESASAAGQSNGAAAAAAVLAQPSQQQPPSSPSPVHPPVQQPHCVSVPPIGDGQLEIYVSAIASPSRFWLQLVGPQSQRLDSMVTEMTEYYGAEGNRVAHKIADPYLGQIVAALFKYDGKWYRAEIVGILPNEFNPRNVVLDLYFVDFGDSEYVAPHEVYELRTDFLTLRFQAIECFLAHVKSTNVDEPEVWTPDSISRFEEITHVAQWKKMHARIVTTKQRKYGDFARRECSPVPGVELFDGNDINIASVLLQEHFALEDVHTIPPALSPPPSPLTESNGQRTDASNGTRSTVHIAYSDPTPTVYTSAESFIESEKRQMLNKSNDESYEGLANSL